jgi:hypothetical protein
VIDEPLVVPMHIPRIGRLFIPISITSAAGFLAWMALDWSLMSAALGIGGLLSFGLIWGLGATNRRVLGGRPMEIVADADGIRTPMWSVRWDRIDRMWIGTTATMRTLNIDVADRTSVTRPRSLFYSLAAFIDRLFRLPAIRIPEMNIDRPLDDLLVQLERKAGDRMRFDPA